jgi:predicted tellurium resistance membrane protein TerC
MDYALSLASDPAAWAALITLIVIEVVLGIDNLIFISILTNRLPEARRSLARTIGVGMALVLRLALLGLISYIVALTEPVFSLFGQAFSWRDVILISGGLFLVWKATKEIHHRVDPDPGPDMFGGGNVSLGFTTVVGQILLLDLVFSIDSMLTAIGMTPHISIMVMAITFTVLVMLLAATPLANFINANPTIVMLALGFLLMIGTVLIADGFGAPVPKGYIYAAMAFAALIEWLNMMDRRARQRRRQGYAPAKAT